ncbi:MAG TPA: hypothetical protein VFR90_08860 [Methylibium sp.]|uniref:hypothetical protein n=1 Tax=Methylibium sp. TaxID=2067992 RepID=UPI002DB7423B|nr:hypothetical protein [Methylibium sp.]HEU4459217.1 hypothetical protein [Methylibium sp.]
MHRAGQLPRLAAALVPLTLTVALVAPARGADPVLGTGAASGKRLSKTQLRQCLELQGKLEAQGAQARRARAELDAAKAEFDRFEAQLQSERTSLDTGNKAAVDAYNAKLEKRRQMVADYNARTPQASAQQQSYVELGRSWKGECENRPYDEDDYAELKSPGRAGN